MLWQVKFNKKKSISSYNAYCNEVICWTAAQQIYLAEKNYKQREGDSRGTNKVLIFALKPSLYALPKTKASHLLPALKK